VSLTVEGREINRHNYSVEEIDEEVRRSVVKKLIHMIQFRNTHPAFNGTFKINQCSDLEISITWTNRKKYATLQVNLTNNTSKISYTDNNSDKEHVLE
jgi:sucrose phosphorylase